MPRCRSIVLLGLFRLSAGGCGRAAAAVNSARTCSSVRRLREEGRESTWERQERERERAFPGEEIRRKNVHCATRHRGREDG